MAIYKFRNHNAPLNIFQTEMVAYLILWSMEI